jgi:hypothetical protein
MMLSNTTKIFIEELNKYKLVTPKKNINDLITCLYNEINIGFKYYNKVKDNIEIETKKINNINKIPFPSSRSDKFFPKDIEDNIKNKSNLYTQCNITVMDVKFKIYFIYTLNTFSIEEYMSIIISWLHIVLNHATRDCSKDIILYIYLSEKNKVLPSRETDIIDVINVNTAYTYCCGGPKTKNEIIIYRKEEWLKTLMHETMHAFGLDFCNLDGENIANIIKNVFPIKSDINLNESYCEFWAETFNILIIAFFSLKENQNIQTYITHVKQLIMYEKTFSIVQAIKILDHMNLTYKDLYKNDDVCIYKRNFFYHENTNVFSYYIIKCIIMYNLEDFIFWCMENNMNLLDFHKTNRNVEKFILFIKSKYKNKSFVNAIEENENKFKKFSKKSKFYKSTKMALVELK